MRIEGIRVKNYGVLRDVTLGEVGDGVRSSGEWLGDIVCVVGEHGAGKSTLIDVFSFLRDCLVMGVGPACWSGGRGGFERMVSGGNAGLVIEITLRFSTLCTGVESGLTEWLCTGAGCDLCFGLEYESYYEYKVGIGVVTQGSVGVVYERLAQFERSSGKELRVLMDLGLGSGCVRVSAGAGSQRVAFSTEGLGLGYSSRRSAGDTWAVGLHWQLSRWCLGEFSLLATEGLEALLRRYERLPSKLVSGVVGACSKIFGGVLGVRTDRAGSVVICIERGGGEQEVLDSRAPRGLLLSLYYALLLNEPLGVGFVGVDNLGDGLLVRALDLLMINLMGFSLELRAQAIVTTHTPRVVDHLESREVWVLGRGADGYAVVKRADQFDFVDNMLADGQVLGSLWQGGYLDF